MKPCNANGVSRTLANLLAGIKHRTLAGNPETATAVEIAVDSREVCDGSVFVAVRGVNVDAHRFIPDALKAGAAAVVCESWPRAAARDGITIVEVQDTRKALSAMAANYWGRPADRMTVIGFTGTDGKSTSSMITENIFSQAGEITGLLGTIEYRAGLNVIPSVQTTPEPLLLHKLFADMRCQGVSHVIMETSSQGLAQSRTDDVPFSVAVLTNLRSDHIEAHGSFENYRDAKGKLFRNLGPDATAILNADDNYYAWFKDVSGGAVLSYSMDSSEADIRGEILAVDLKEMVLKISTPDWDRTIRSELIGGFNAENILAAVSAAWSSGVDPDVIAAAVHGVKRPPGRLELIRVPGGRHQPVCLVDYAHTPAAMETVLRTLSSLVRGKLICLFGCGGERDHGKRPEMGRIATMLSDYVVLTTDNSRSEKPEEILADIQSGILPGSRNYDVIVARREAIAEAIAITGDSSDCVVIMGKGHESGQIEGGIIRPFDDRVVARQVMEQIYRDWRRVA